MQSGEADYHRVALTITSFVAELFVSGCFRQTLEGGSGFQGRAGRSRPEIKAQVTKQGSRKNRTPVLGVPVLIIRTGLFRRIRWDPTK